jgi:diguanylate cyclase
MTASVPPLSAHLQQVARPLLKLVRHLTGMETTFFTRIDWDNQQQEVVFSLNEGNLTVSEGSTVDWKDSMCRTMFLSGRAQTDNVPLEPLRPSTVDSAMKSFFALPILVDDDTIGTVCGASESQVVLDEHQIAAVEMIADAMRHLIQAQIAKSRTFERLQQAESLAEQMMLLAHTDALTGLPNRRAFSARLEDQLARSGRKQYEIAVLLIDMDHFKKVNDTWGHTAGDTALVALGRAIRSLTTSADLPARLGGDEFALAVSHIDDATVMALAERIRLQFAAATAELGTPATISIGIATSTHCGRDQLLGAADQALYRCKSEGGNRVELWQEDPATCCEG